MSDQPWYVIQSKPRKESQVSAYLKSQGLEVFYPTLKVQPVNPRASTIRPLFPRYLFVQADLDEVGMSALQWVPGAIGLVEFDGVAAPIHDAVVKAIRRRVQEIREVGGLTFDGLEQGDRVLITDGPLKGYEAIFDLRLSGSERVQVLLEMLGRQMRVTVNANAIERVRRRR